MFKIVHYETLIKQTFSATFILISLDSNKTNTVITDNQLNSASQSPINNNIPSVLWPGRDLVAGMQNGSPLVPLTDGKCGSPSGTGIGKHCGWTVVPESQDKQFRIPSLIKPAEAHTTVKVKHTLSINNHRHGKIALYLLPSGYPCQPCLGSPALVGANPPSPASGISTYI